MSRCSILPSKHMQEILDIYMSNISCICTFLPCHISKLGSRFIRWRIGLLKSVTFQLLLRMLSLFSQSLKSYEHLHFSDPVVEISDRHVENMIFLGKTNTAIHDPHINGMGSSIAIIILTIMWKITT